MADLAVREAGYVFALQKASIEAMAITITALTAPALRLPTLQSFLLYEKTWKSLAGTCIKARVSSVAHAGREH